MHTNIVNDTNSDIINDNFFIGSIEVSPQHNTMTNGDTIRRLQPKVMALLQYLANNHERVIGNDELLDQVWQGRVVTHSSIQKSINALRTAFSELDDRYEYVVYFSKRGYQLIIPDVDNLSQTSSTHTRISKPFIYISFITAITGVLLILLYMSALDDNNEKLAVTPTATKSIIKNTQFTQVKPYVSNTGREKLIEPHSTSDRVAFIREEFTSEGKSKKSHLYIHSSNGQIWPVSVARGNFVDLAWSPSGRNLVAIDVHAENNLATSAPHQESVHYVTFHIYTLDFKGEKIIEKNTLSHWNGNVSSVSWWNEEILEFTASQQGQYERARYRYAIAEQNLSWLPTPKSHSLHESSTLLESHITQNKTALLSLLNINEVNTSEKIQFLDEKQNIISEWSMPFKVISMHWLSDATGVFLLSEKNQIFLLDTNGNLRQINYSPKVNGSIKHVRSKNKAQQLVLTVTNQTNESSAFLDTVNIKPKQVNTINTQNNVNPSNIVSPEMFMEKGGGFIYSTPDPK